MAYGASMVSGVHKTSPSSIHLEDLCLGFHVRSILQSLVQLENGAWWAVPYILHKY